MNRSTRIFFALLLLALIVINNSFAGIRVARPFRHQPEKLNYTVQKLDSFLSSSITVTENVSRDRICSCQILNLESSNYNHQHIAVFAEKTNHGSSADFAAAKSRINKEKKHLKNMFYDKVEVVAEVEAKGSCHAMYVKLKSKDARLQIYEILNADIR